MATIIDNPPKETERIIERDSETAGWAVAIIILIAVIGGLLWYFQYYRAAPAVPQSTETPSGGSANINVTLPGATTGQSSGQATTSGEPSGAY